MIKSLVAGLGIFTMAGGIAVSGLGEFMPNQTTLFHSEKRRIKLPWVSGLKIFSACLV